MDIVTYALAKKYTDEHSTDSGVLVAMVDQTMSMPTARTDGSPLQNEDYVKPKKTATFPFTINGITFENKFSKAIYFNGEWVVDVGLIQDTAETPLANMAQESFEEARQNQKQVNIDTVYQLKNAIIEYEDLDTVPTNKLYKRIYRQTADTDARTAGLYWRNFTTNKWEKFGSGDIEAGNLLPSGKYEGELFILLEDVTGNPKTKKGLYRYNGSLWVHIAHTEPYSTEIEVKDKTVESISKTAITQEAINKENALIIGQDKEIDVDEEVDLIGAVNWLNENKTARKRLTLKSFGDPAKPYAILDGEEELDYEHLKALVNSSKYAVELVDRATILHPSNNMNINDTIDFVATFKDEDGFFSMMCYVVSMREDGYIKTSFVNLENTYYKMQDFDLYQPEFDTEGKQYTSAQAVYKQLIKETEFELDETGTKDKLSLKVTNNNGDDIIDEEVEIDKVLIRVNALPDANVNVSRFYLLTEDTAAYDAGIYYATMDDDEVVWTKVGGDDEQGGILVATVKQGDTMPTQRPDGTDLQNEDYVKPQPTATFPFTIDGVTFDNKFTKAIYFNNAWIIDAGLIQDTSETPVVDKTVESIDGTATTQKAINTQVADIIGKDKTIEVDDKDTLIDAVNWLNDNKVTKKRLRIDAEHNVIDDDNNIVTIEDIVKFISEPAYLPYFQVEESIFFFGGMHNGNLFRFVGVAYEEEDIGMKNLVEINYGAFIDVTQHGKASLTKARGEMVSYKISSLSNWEEEEKEKYRYPERVYPSAQAVVDYVDEHASKLYEIENSIEYGGAMIPKFVKDDIIAIADYLAKGINVTIKDKYNAYYSVIRADHLNDGEYEIEHEYYDGKSIVWTYMTDGDAITYKMVEPILVDKEYDALETVNKTVIGAINELNSIETYQFKGYVSMTEPTGTLKEGELWYLGDEMPTTFPINVKEYKNGAWSALVVQYTPTSLDLWADLENKHGYYWFGNAWNLIDIDIEVDNETIDFNDAGQIKVADEAIKNKHINPELKATVIEEDDDDQLATEGAVYGELVKETTFELDETGVKDKLTLKVTNNSDNDIINKEIEFDKVIIKVSAFPTENVNFSHLYLLTEDTDDYDAGLYYAVKDGDNIVWTKAGANEGIIYVDALPETDIDTQVFYYLKAKVDDFEAGLYYAVLKDDGTYKWHYLEESGIVAVEDEDTGIITFENGSATPYEAIIPVDALPTTNIQTGFFYRLKANVGDYEAGMYYAIKNDDGTYTWVQDGATITDQIKIVKYFQHYESQTATDGLAFGAYKTFEISIGLEGYEPVAILNPRSAQSVYYDETLDYDGFNNALEILVGNVKFKLNDTTKVVGAFINHSPNKNVVHYMDIAFDVMYFKKA